LEIKYETVKSQFKKGPDPEVRTKIHCTNCEKDFEIAGSQGNQREVRTIVVSCPYDDCGKLFEVRWSKHQQALVRKMP